MKNRLNFSDKYRARPGNKIDEEIEKLKEEQAALAQSQEMRPKHGQHYRNAMDNAGMNLSAFEILSNNSAFKPNEKIQAKITDIIKVFHHFDIDKGGTIDYEEALMLGNFFELDKLEASKMYKEIDINSDGEIQLLEWIDYVKNLGESSPEKTKIMEKLNDKKWIRQSLNTKINKNDIVNNVHDMKIDQKVKEIHFNEDYLFSLANDKVQDDKNRDKMRQSNNFYDEFDSGTNDLKKIHFGFLNRKSKMTKPSMVKKGLLAKPSISYNSNFNNRPDVFSPGNKFNPKLNANIVLNTSQDYNYESKFKAQYEIANKYITNTQPNSPKNNLFGTNNSIYNFNNEYSKTPTHILNKKDEFFSQQTIEEEAEEEKEIKKVNRRNSIEVDTEFMLNNFNKKKDDKNNHVFNPKLSEDNKISRRKSAVVNNDIGFELPVIKTKKVRRRVSLYGIDNDKITTKDYNNSHAKYDINKKSLNKIESIDELADFMDKIESEEKKAKDIIKNIKKKK